MKRRTGIILTVILMLFLSLTTSHMYSELHPFSIPSEYITPLAFSNETPNLFYVRYFTNASKVIVLFENKENAEKFASFIQNSSVVITSDGMHADVLMKREALAKILELADYADETKLSIDGYWNPSRIEEEYGDLNFLLTNYSFPEPIKDYLLDRFRERAEDIDRIERAKNFMLTHKGLEFYEIELIEPSHSMEYPDLSSDLTVILLAEIALVILAVLERERKIRAIFLISFLLLTVPTYQLLMYERELNNHEQILSHITRTPEKHFNWTSYKSLNGSIGISCYVSNIHEIENLLAAVNSSGIVGIEHSLRGTWLHMMFVDGNPRRFLLFKECDITMYGYSCTKEPTEEELEVINRTKELLKEIPEDKKYLVEDALSSYNTTVSSCNELFNPESIPPGKYMVSLTITPSGIGVPDLQLVIQMMASVIVILFLVLFFVR